MTFQQKDDTGALFKNERKESDRHPDYTGTAMIGGDEYRLAAWIKRSKAGKTFMSLSFTAKDAGPVSSVGSNEQPEFEDEIPF